MQVIFIQLDLNNISSLMCIISFLYFDEDEENKRYARVLLKEFLKNFVYPDKRLIRPCLSEMKHRTPAITKHNAAQS